MATIDTSDCRLEIGIGRKFARSLTWHFARFLHQNLHQAHSTVCLNAKAIDNEARRMANEFTDDMQAYFRATLSDTYEDFDNLGPDGIVDLYVQENLEDYEADYLNDHLPGFRTSCDGMPSITPRLDTSAGATCH
ncbi:MAG: hypothetical protein WCK65_03900 [Rhodospirillaceae bacterium]